MVTTEGCGILGRVHFLLRSISPSQIHLNYSVIVPCFSSPSQKENLLNAFSNQNVGKYSTFSNGNTFSAPSQMEYMFYISRNLLRFFSMEIPSQLLLKWSTCSTSVLMISYEIRKSLESKNSHSAHQSTYLFALCMVWASMTQLLTHSVAHSTKPSSRPKTNNQSIKKFLSLAVSCVKVVKNWLSF